MKSFKFSIQGVLYEVEIKSIEGNNAQVDVNGTTYDVEIQRQIPVSKTPILVRNPQKAPEVPKTATTTGFARVRSPLPGNIMNVVKKDGDQVKRGDLVLTYEAMKMENRILAEKDGIIRQLKLNPGDNIIQDQVLFEIE